MLNKSRDSLIQSCIHLTEKHGIRDMPGSGLGTMVGTIASAALKEHTVLEERCYMDNYTSSCETATTTGAKKERVMV